MNSNHDFEISNLVNGTERRGRVQDLKLEFQTHVRGEGSIKKQGSPLPPKNTHSPVDACRVHDVDGGHGGAGQRSDVEDAEVLEGGEEHKHLEHRTPDHLQLAARGGGSRGWGES